MDKRNYCLVALRGYASSGANVLSLDFTTHRLKSFDQPDASCELRTRKRHHENCSLIDILAFHEAGHAVIAWKLGVRLRGLELTPQLGLAKYGLVLSYAMHPDFMSPGDWREVENTALILLGGEKAEELGVHWAGLNDDPELVDRFRGAYEFSVAASSPGSDRARLRELIDRFFPDLEADGEKWLANCAVKAEGLLLENWDRLEVLANALLSARFLTGDQTKEILERA